MKYFRTCCIILALISIVLSYSLKNSKRPNTWGERKGKKAPKEETIADECEKIRNEIENIKFNNENDNSDIKSERTLKHLKSKLAECKRKSR